MRRYLIAYVDLKLFIFITLAMLLGGCTIKDSNHAAGDNPAYLTPISKIYGVAMHVDQLDGQAVNYNESKRLVLDNGSHDLNVRLEYQPAAGSSVIVGGLGNLLLRGATNKTFRQDITVDLTGGHEYGLIVKDTEQGFELLVFDETDRGVVILEHQFKFSDGKIERLF
jgi:hypothetical protein